MTQLIKIDNQEFNLDRESETLFATQEQIANIFETTKQNVSLHIQNIFKDGELQENSVIKDFLTTASDGKNYNTKFYNLDVIIAVGYRIKSKKATDFRIKATKILKKYLTTGEVKKTLPPINSTFLLQIAEEMQKKENLIAEQQHKIESQDNTIYNISNTQDSYSVRESKNRLMCEEGQLKDFLKSKKWIQYLSDGEECKKMYSTAYSKENGFAIDKAVLNKANKKFYHQCRITNKGMDYLIKHRQEILTF